MAKNMSRAVEFREKETQIETDRQTGRKKDKRACLGSNKTSG